MDFILSWMIPSWNIDPLNVKGGIEGIVSVMGDYQTEALATLSILLATIISAIFFFKRWKRRGVTHDLIGSSRPRFRKRDKVLFYGRKMLRKVKSISGQVHQSKKRKLFLKFARKLLQLKKDTSATQLQVLEPSAEYLEEDVSTKFDKNIPPDVQSLLQSLRVFGKFEMPIFLTLCKRAEILSIPSGSFLFKIGDPDENLYVVQSGLLNVFITDSNGTIIPLKQVSAGDSVSSLLSFTDVLMQTESSYKTVSAKAVQDSKVVRLPMRAFQEVFEDYPDILIRVVQTIMVRLQRVTFTTLHEYLGLTVELMRAPEHVTIHQHHSHAYKNRRGSGSPESPDTSKFRGVIPSIARPLPFDSGGRRELDTTLNIPGASPPGPDCDGSNSRRMKPLVGEDMEILTRLAITAFTRALGLDNETLLENHVDVLEAPAGSYIVRQDSHKDIALVYVLTGALNMSQRPSDAEHDVIILTIPPGEIIGGLAVLTGESSFFTIRARHVSKVGLISRTSFYEIIKLRPKVVLHVAHMVVQRLSPFVRQVDFALDWVFLESGRALYRQESEAESTYLVLSGRLRSVITRINGKKELMGEYGRGELIGIVEMVTQTPRSTTVMAVRDSELAKLPEGLFNVIKLRYPTVVTRLITLLGHRILGTKSKSGSGIDPSSDVHQSLVNLSTVALVPVTEDVPLTAVGYELYHALSQIGQTLRLTSDVIRKTLGPGILDSNNEYRLTSWLAQQEDQHKIAIYQCDTSYTLWTQRCIRQADCILIVGLADKGPALGKMEKQIERIAVRTQKELVLLHNENAERPNNTVQWLNARSWVSSHHHILCSKRMFSRRSQSRINELYAKVLSTEPNVHSDFSRLARWLTGTSVGLVLGGGGARGAAHVGMIKAIQDAGIPIDMVGGVSIGSFVGGLWCMEKDITTVTQKARDWSKKMTQWWRQLFDLTYPVTSIFTGKDFNHTIYSTFGEVQIEDLWLPYFNITTDISSSSMRIHRHADVMRNFGARHILAIDVGSHDDQDLTNYGDSLSGFWLLYKRWNPFTQPVKVPDLSDIQSRLSYVSCVRQLEEVKHSDYCDYIRPPVDQYKTLSFGLFDEIKEVGYNYGKMHFAGLLKSGELPLFKSEGVLPMNSLTSGYTFTDLAQMVCKVPRRSYAYGESSSSSSEYEEDEEEYQVGYASEPSASILRSAPKQGEVVRRGMSLSENELESDAQRVRNGQCTD